MSTQTSVDIAKDLMDQAQALLDARPGSGPASWPRIRRPKKHKGRKTKYNRATTSIKARVMVALTPDDAKELIKQSKLSRRSMAAQGGLLISLGMKLFKEDHLRQLELTLDRQLQDQLIKEQQEQQPE